MLWFEYKSCTVTKSVWQITDWQLTVVQQWDTPPSYSFLFFSFLQPLQAFSLFIVPLIQNWCLLSLSPFCITSHIPISHLTYRHMNSMYDLRMQTTLIGWAKRSTCRLHRHNLLKHQYQYSSSLLNLTLHNYPHWAWVGCQPLSVMPFSYIWAENTFCCFC